MAYLRGKRSCLEEISDYFLYNFLQIEGRVFFLSLPWAACSHYLFPWLGQPHFSVHLYQLHSILPYKEGLQEDFGGSLCCCVSHPSDGEKEGKKGREGGKERGRKALF